MHVRYALNNTAEEGYEYAPEYQRQNVRNKRRGGHLLYCLNLGIQFFTLYSSCKKFDFTSDKIESFHCIS